jgi:small subunit ribosomal protein S4
MARYTGPKNRINRKFGEPILGSGKDLDKNSFPPGQHGNSKKRKTQSEYAVQLREKQKAKYTYMVLEKQFRNTYFEAARLKGATGENLMKLLESRLDNTVFRMGFAPTRTAARQLVSHNHIMVNGHSVNIPSYQMKPGDVLELKPKSKANTSITSMARPRGQRITWVDFNEKDFKGTFIMAPERENVPENIKEQLIVELYSK